MKILGPDKFSKEDIDGMRDTLCECEYEALREKNLRQILWEGCIGWENIPDAEVVEHYQNIYGESGNYEMIQGEVSLKEKELIICDKKIKEQQAVMIAKFNDIK